MKAISETISTGKAAAELGCTKQYVNKLKKRYVAEGRAPRGSIPHLGRTETERKQK